MSRVVAGVLDSIQSDVEQNSRVRGAAARRLDEGVQVAVSGSLVAELAKGRDKRPAALACGQAWPCPAEESMQGGDVRRSKAAPGSVVMVCSSS